MFNKAQVQFYTPDRNATCDWLTILNTTQDHGQTSREVTEGQGTTYFSKAVMLLKQTD